jgi:hypothetical protein
VKVEPDSTTTTDNDKDKDASSGNDRKKMKKEKSKDEKEESPLTPRSSRSATATKSDGGSGGRRASSRGQVKKEDEMDEEEESDKDDDAKEEKKTAASKKKGAKGGRGKKRKADESEGEEEEKGGKEEKGEKEEKEEEEDEVKVKTEPGADDNKMEVEKKDEIVKEEGADDVVKKEGEEEIKTEAEKKEKEEKDKEVEEAVPAGVAAGLDKDGIPIAFEGLKDDTEDVDDVQESEHFDNRLAFLNLCTGNHYQYDQLRRAKHSSMMVLYHLHNPDAPKFVPQCAICHKEILSGYRHTCQTCEVDYCNKCVSIHGPRVHHHPLRPVAVAGGAPVQLTEEQRKERARSIKLHMELLTHAAECVSPTCPFKNCKKMKDFLRHESACKVGAVRGCRLCTRINGLLNMHARSCKNDECVVPKCKELKEQARKMSLRQNQMDDRRRAKMNDTYSRAATQGMSGGLSEIVTSND